MIEVLLWPVQSTGCAPADMGREPQSTLGEDLAQFIIFQL